MHADSRLRLRLESTTTETIEVGIESLRRPGQSPTGTPNHTPTAIVEVDPPSSSTATHIPLQDSELRLTHFTHLVNSVFPGSSQHLPFPHAHVLANQLRRPRPAALARSIRQCEKLFRPLRYGSGRYSIRFGQMDCGGIDFRAIGYPG